MPASVYAILSRFAGDGGARVRTGNDLRDPRRCAGPRREASPIRVANPVTNKEVKAGLRRLLQGSAVRPAARATRAICRDRRSGTRHRRRSVHRTVGAGGIFNAGSNGQTHDTERSCSAIEAQSVGGPYMVALDPTALAHRTLDDRFWPELMAPTG
jgi:hypothetical protein